MQPPSEPQPKEKAHVVSEKVDIESSGGGQSPTLGSKDATSMDLEQDGVIDPVAEARLLRKLDWILLPMFTAIYCCNFIDRTSIGNARVAGLEADLGMEGLDLNIALTVFYVCIFLVEGVITTLFGILLFFILPDDPVKSRLLSPEERRMVIARKYRDNAHFANKDAAGAVKHGGEPEKTTWKLVLRSFSFITVACTLGFIMINMSFQGLSLFLPSVIRSLGSYSTVEIQLRTVPPYLVSAVWAVANAFLSSRIKMRWLPLLWNTLFGVVGYAISVSTQNPHARYAACFLIIVAGGVVGPMLVIWGTDNAAPDTMRAVVSGAIPGIGAIGAVMAVWTYLPSDAPNYRKGNLGNLGTMSTLCVIICTIATYIKWENAKRAKGGRDYRLEGKTEEELRNMGYRHPEFRYQI
ncbi:hypothetical protein MD484_g7568, partial [Candolleomyces efflorescens]